MAWRVPLNMNIQNGKGKQVLRQILKTYVPEALFERPKMGFGVPIDHWLRGPLKDWAADLLNEQSLSDMMDPTLVMERWQAHLQGQNHHYSLWPILMLQAWRRRWGY
jgi:asparagine synthase (glutamine-hydrolysing)